MPGLGEFVIIACFKNNSTQVPSQLKLFHKTMSSQNTRFTRQAGSSSGVSRGSYYTGKSKYRFVSYNDRTHVTKVG